MLVIGSSASAIAAACGANSDATTTTQEGGAEEDAVVVGACPSPSSRPANGSPCLLPEGTTCEFGLCGTRLARCSRGLWVLAANPPPRPPCPDVAPNKATKCPDCWPPEVSCTYGSTDCSLADASDNTAIASCPAGGWVVDFRPCRDAGADVQGDGGPDAD